MLAYWHSFCAAAKAKWMDWKLRFRGKLH